MSLTRTYTEALNAAVVLAREGKTDQLPACDDELVKIYVSTFGEDAYQVVVELKRDMPASVFYEWYLACRERSYNNSAFTTPHQPKGYAFYPSTR